MADKTSPTIRLYFEDSYRTEFEATVVARSSLEGQPAVVLDRTCFYPESGGQPWDTGKINSVPVVKVVEEGETILHVLERDLDPVVAAGASVVGRIDWDRRFEHMQQHTGQHILSQAFLEILEGETRSFHLGEESSTLEIGLSKVEEEGIERVEQAANDILYRNLEVKTYFVPADKISEVPLRRPPKKEGLIRVVEVDGFDYSACGGTHCRRTGEVGLVKITRWEKIRGNLRFDFLCGERALGDYILKNSMLRRVSGLFSVSEKEAFASVEKSLAELKAQKKSYRVLQENLARYEAREVIQRTEGKIIRQVFSDKTPDEVRLLALSIIRQASRVVLFAAKALPQSHIILARSDDIQMDLRKYIPVLNDKVSGKGGGSASLVEIVTSEHDKIEDALLQVEEAIAQGGGN